MVKNPPRPGLRRRDATGHLDPRYAAELLEQSRDNQTFDPPSSGFVQGASDDLAEQLGEGFVQAATSAEDGDDDEGDELISDEPSVPDGDDDDLAFDPDELSFPAARPERAPGGTVPKRKTPAARPKPAKASANVGRGSSRSKTKAAKANAVKRSRKTPKRRRVRKAGKRTR